MHTEQKKPDVGVEEDLFKQILSVVEGDAKCWLHAAQHCETFSGGLPEQDKVIANLLNAVYRERATIHKGLVAKLRRRLGTNGAREIAAFHEVRTGCSLTIANCLGR